MKRLFPLILCALVACRTPAGAEPQWQDVDALGPGDAALAQQVAVPFWGEDPSQWPDWLDLKAVRIPTQNGGTIVVVRVPWHAPCGQYAMTVLGPVTADHTRLRLGVDFCAGELGVMPVEGRDMPDLLMNEGRTLDPVSGAWVRHDQRIRWATDHWVLVLAKSP